MGCCAVILILIIAYTAYKYYNQVFNHWKSRGVPYAEPPYTVVSWINLARKKTNLIESFRSSYNDFSDKRYEQISTIVINTIFI